jgi:hypothetical protein
MYLWFVFTLLAVILQTGVQLDVLNEVRTFIDEAGNLRIGDHVYKKMKKPDVDIVQPSRLFDSDTEEDGASSAPNSEQLLVPLGCPKGDRISLEYGSMNTTYVLPHRMLPQELSILRCGEAFGRKSFSGHLVLTCVPTGNISIQYHCGCAISPLLRTDFQTFLGFPKFYCLPRSYSIGMLMPQISMETSKDDLIDGEIRTFPCDNLYSSLQGTLRISCSNGDLCIDKHDCAPAFTAQELIPQRWLGDDRIGEAPVRRLNPCLDPFNDHWWPTICDSVKGVPYSTVAGANNPGSEVNQFQTNMGVYVSPVTGDVFVADWGNHRIQRWNAAGTAVTVAGRTGEAGNGVSLDTLQNPRDVVVAGRSTNEAFGCGELFIADEGHHRILRWPPGSLYGFVVAGGGADVGTRPNQINKPTGIAVTDALDIYICDQLNHRIVVWSKQKAALTWKYNQTVAGSLVGAQGAQLSRLNNPTDVSLNANEEVFIADSRNDRIVKWVVGASEGTLIGTCAMPISVYVTIENGVYAACQTDHCIKRWDWDGTKHVPGVDTGECGFFGIGLNTNDPGYICQSIAFMLHKECLSMGLGMSLCLTLRTLALSNEDVPR